MKAFVGLISLFIVLSICCIVYGESIEQDFKKLCAEINKEQVIFLDSEKTKSDFEKWNKLAEGWRQDLQTLVNKEPTSIWADDAQYLKARLSTMNKEMWIKEFESVLEKYPNCNTEQWTKESLPLLVPQQVPLYIEVRAELISSYKSSGNNDKAQKLYDESIIQYPKAKRFFKINYHLTDLSIENLMKLSDEELEELAESVDKLDSLRKEKEEKARDNLKE